MLLLLFLNQDSIRNRRNKKCLSPQYGQVVCRVCFLVYHSSPNLLHNAPFTLRPQVLSKIMYRIYSIDKLVEGFTVNFDRYYADAMATDFNQLSLQDQVAYVKMLYKVGIHRDQGSAHIGLWGVCEGYREGGGG